MKPTDVVVAVLLGLAGLIQALCVLGVWLMPHVFDRLHFLTPATSVAPWLVAAAIWTREALDHQGIAALLVASGALVSAIWRFAGPDIFAKRPEPIRPAVEASAPDPEFCQVTGVFE